MATQPSPKNTEVSTGKNEEMQSANLGPRIMGIVGIVGIKETQFHTAPKTRTAKVPFGQVSPAAKSRKGNTVPEVRIATTQIRQGVWYNNQSCITGRVGVTLLHLLSWFDAPVTFLALSKNTGCSRQCPPAAHAEHGPPPLRAKDQTCEQSASGTLCIARGVI